MSAVYKFDAVCALAAFADLETRFMNIDFVTTAKGKLMLSVGGFIEKSNTIGSPFCFPKGFPQTLRFLA